MEPPRELAGLDLIGLPVDRARELVENVGGVLRAVAPGDAIRLDYRTNRVTVIVVDGEVIESRGVG